MKLKFPKIWQILCVLVILTMAMSQTGVVFADDNPPPDGTEEVTETTESTVPTEEQTPVPGGTEPTTEATEPTVEATPKPTKILGDLELRDFFWAQRTPEPTGATTGTAGTVTDEEAKQLTLSLLETDPQETEVPVNTLVETIMAGLMGSGDDLTGLLPGSTGMAPDILARLAGELAEAGVSPEDPDFAKNLNEIVNILSAQGLALFDQEGSPLPLVSTIAAEVLSDADPMGCPEGVTPTWLGGSGEGCTASYTSIQDAIDDDLVKDGWTIYIQAGVFQEQVDVNKNVRLKGHHGTILRTPTNLTKSFGMGDFYLIGVHEKVESVIEGMVIDGGNYYNPALGRLSGISFYGSSGGVYRNEIMNFIGGAGISAFNAKDVTVAENDIHDNSVGVEAVASADITVEDNEIHDNGVGVGSFISAEIEVVGNTIENNVVGVKSQSSAAVTILDNTINENWVGVKLFDSADVVVAENQINDNHIGVSHTYGLFNPITNNEISGNDGGIVNMLSVGTQITNNEITDNMVGVTNGLTLFTDINGNRIADNGVGLLHVVSVGTEVHYNEIEDNQIGVINANLIFPVHGEYNWWGCNGGPGAPGCNGIYNVLAANFRFRPWLTDFDVDGAYTADDNCPYVYNPDQTDSDHDGIGDACEETSLYIAGRTVTFNGVLIPVTGANVVQLKCGGTTTLKLPDGSIAMVDNLCGYSANLTDRSVNTVPSAMLVGNPKYMNLQFLQPAVPSTARFTYSFAVPSAFQGHKFKVIYWDEKLGIWTTIPPRMVVNGEVVMVPLYPDHPDKRMVLEGVHMTTEGMVQFTTNFPGVFVLVLDE
jgi:parallel beta-helix repeat protein